MLILVVAPAFFLSTTAFVAGRTALIGSRQLRDMAPEEQARVYGPLAGRVGAWFVGCVATLLLAQWLVPA